MITDHRKLPRRRGDALYDAILEATRAELAEVGYAKLTMERVAARAKAGKASLYRRWSSRMELAVDAVYHVLPDPAAVPDTGSLRSDLLATLRRAGALLSGPAGQALRGLLSDALGDPARAAELRQHSAGTGRSAMREIVRRAVERGEIDGAAVTPRRLDVLKAMLRQEFLFGGAQIPDEVLVEIVDDVVLPLLRSG
ncbi:MAG: TetR/AcrR family transcriptional regulator [Micromonosporaceae bacterium]